MPNPQEPGPEAESSAGHPVPTAGTAAEPAEPHTEVFTTPSAGDAPDAPVPAGERRFTAPSGFDAGSTQIIDQTPEPVTEIIDMDTGSVGPVAYGAGVRPKDVGPQEIPARDPEIRSVPDRLSRRRRGWMLAVTLVIAALAALAVLGTVLITRDGMSKASQEELVRTTIQKFDNAIQKGDLATLRSITCGATADSYNKFGEQQWADLHARVAAAKQYPVVASIDEVVINGPHAEANVTSFMAFDPSTRSTRSFDLEFRDEQWKICQAPGS